MAGVVQNVLLQTVKIVDIAMGKKNLKIFF
jgi:hypothetical protein